MTTPLSVYSRPVVWLGGNGLAGAGVAGDGVAGDGLAGDGLGGESLQAGRKTLTHTRHTAASVRTEGSIVFSIQLQPIANLWNDKDPS